MSIPSPSTMAKAVLLTAGAIIAIKIVKPYLPATLQGLLTL